MITLEITKRTKAEKLEAIRKNGLIPAVYYGRKEASTPISLKETDFMKAWKEAGESSIVKLKTSDGLHDALIHEVAVDPVSGKVVHADFYVVEKGKKIKVKIPIEFEGTAPAVKELGGTLVKVLHEIEIEAEAADLPHGFTVDISSLLNFESQILAKDISMPAGVRLVDNPEEVVALVTEAKEEEVEAAPVDLANIELSEKKGKKEEEGAVEGEAKAGAPAQ
jgi:large subunit ribosomal protein L25